jgi:hypothetical protein
LPPPRKKTADLRRQYSLPNFHFDPTFYKLMSARAQNLLPSPADRVPDFSGNPKQSFQANNEKEVFCNPSRLFAFFLIETSKRYPFDAALFRVKKSARRFSISTKTSALTASNVCSLLFMVDFLAR